MASIPPFSVRREILRQPAAILLSLGAVLAGTRAHAQSTPASPSATDTATVWDYRLVTTEPRLLNESLVARMIARNYPPDLRDAGIVGTATLLLTIRADGRVEEASVLHATERGFGAAALRLSRFMRFSPARVGRTPVRCRFTLPITFSLLPSHFEGPSER
jgi:TonB family protein